MSSIYDYSKLVEKIERMTNHANSMISIQNRIQNTFYSIHPIVNIQNRMQSPFENVQNITDIHNAILQILSIADIPTFNNQLQYFYNNITEDIEKNVDEDTIQLAQIACDAVEKFNENPNTIEKIKNTFSETPFAKDLKYFLALFATIASILYYSGFNIKEDFIEPVLNNIQSSKTTDITNK
ncbi:hypothetical protein AAK894_12985 [Lachnospiraceae bacterium 46-61]